MSQHLEEESELEQDFKISMLKIFIKTKFSHDFIIFLEKIIISRIENVEKCVNLNQIDKFNSNKIKIKKLFSKYNRMMYFLLINISIRAIIWFILFSIYAFIAERFQFIKDNSILNSYTGNVIFLLFTLISGFFLKEDALILFNMQKFITKHEKHLKYLDYKVKLKK